MNDKYIIKSDVDIVIHRPAVFFWVHSGVPTISCGALQWRGFLPVR